MVSQWLTQTWTACENQIQANCNFPFFFLINLSLIEEQKLRQKKLWLQVNYRISTKSFLKIYIFPAMTDTADSSTEVRSPLSSWYKTTQPAYYEVNVQLPVALLHSSVINTAHFIVLHLPRINNFRMMRRGKCPTCSDSQDHITFNNLQHTCLYGTSKNQLCSTFSFRLWINWQ